MALDFHVIIDVDAPLEPVGMEEAFGRQRLQGRPIKLVEEIAARATAVSLHRASTPGCGARTVPTSAVAPTGDSIFQPDAHGRSTS